jgi:N-dimethylarginine dimethylaminohydrolase
MVAPLRVVVMKRPEQAFRDKAAIARQWQPLAYVREPDLAIAAAEHRDFAAILAAAGATVLYLPEDSRTGLDSLYAHDPVLITDRGAVILQTGKLERRGEGPAFEDALKGWGVPILGHIGGAGTAEAGDMVWLDRHTLAVGRGFRTNQAGLDQLTALLQPLDVSVVPVPLPYASGPADVLHLMSFISLLDEDLAIVHRPLLPVPFYELLVERKIALVDVPEAEYPTLGCNVLAVSPREVVLAAGNPVTRSRLEAAGCRVTEFRGAEICLPGSGGPTCLTRPLFRAG